MKADQQIQSKKKTASIAGITITAISNICFAGMTIVLKSIYVRSNISAYEVAYARGLTGFIFNLIYSKVIDVEILEIGPEVAKQLLFRVGFGLFGMIAYALSNKLLPISLAGALSSTDPIFTSIIGWIIYSESLSKFDTVALILAFLGVLCIVMNPMRASNDQEYSFYYMLVPLSGSIASGFVYNFTRQLAQLAHWVIAPTYFGLGIACSIPIILLYTESRRLDVTNYDILLVGLLLFMNILGWLGQLLMSKALQIEIAGRVAVINYLQIVILFISDVIIFHSNVNIFDILGTVLIIGCNFIIGLLKFLAIID